MQELKKQDEQALSQQKSGPQAQETTEQNPPQTSNSRARTQTNEREREIAIVLLVSLTSDSKNVKPVGRLLTSDSKM